MTKFVIIANNKEELLKAGIVESSTSSIALVEEGFTLPNDKEICIVYKANSLPRLIEMILCTGRMASNEVDTISCYDDERIMLVPVDEIEFITADRNRIECYIKKGRILQIKKKIYELEYMLSSKGFFRVNKSTIVNVREIKDISPWFGGRLLLRMKNGTDEIEVSRKYSTDFKEYLGV
ncbi:MAG: LytTR family transcriptional regulator DNA-binding domain-containing protein [Spirochaetes bacterium]|nr:LytTR family transcriptional regulator DNA-binding domain-containing protein [Spirochaetota bacterium]MBN2770926.1 LytTR family transcriptional regulator DNA-binding domain-containing protein [Spirochaetota bacterium]